MKRSRSALLLAGVLAGAALRASAGVAAPLGAPAVQPGDDAPLPADPRIVSGVFENGMRYAVMKHAVPPGRAALWLHVSTGSLNETEGQRGIAHFLEHMAFNGSESFPPGTVVDFFQGLGLTFGRHQNASTSFDRTNYRLEMPDNQPETAEKAAKFLSDVAFRLTLPQEEIEKERGVILEEKRARLSAQQRVQEAWLKRIAPGSLLGDRIPIGVEATINGVQRTDFAEYYSKWYVPANMAVFMVADMDTDRMVQVLRQHFAASGARGPRPTDQDLGLRPTSESAAVVVTDAEISQASLGILQIRPARPPVTTRGLLREQVVERLGQIAFNRRIEKKIAKGAFSGLRGGMSSGDFANAARITQVSAAGSPGKWRSILADAAAELQRARTHGFSDREIVDARREVLSQAEQAVQTESTRNASAILASWDAAYAAEEPVTSAQQDLDLLKSLSFTTADVNRAFRDMIEPAAVVFSLQCPAGPDVPAEKDLLDAGRAALAASVAPDAESAVASSLMASPPTPVAVAAPTVHPATDVATWTLPNGIVAHHTFNDFRKNAVSVSITLAGGELLETAQNRGISDAAVTAWQRPATGVLASTDINDLLVGKKVTVGGFSQPDALALSITGSPEDVETGFQLVHLLLTDPRLEQAAFDQWRTTELQSIAASRTRPGSVLSKTLFRTVFPESEVRVQPLTEDQVNALTREQAQAWISRLIAQSPVEIAIVGDLPRDRAAQLLSSYIATLPARSPISAATLAAERRLQRPTGPRMVRQDVPTQTKQAQVLSGFYGTDAANTRDSRLLNAAAQVLSTRGFKRIREQEQLAYSPRFSSEPASAYPGFGMFLCGAPTDPEKAARLAEVIGEMYAEFAREGPTEQEVAEVRKQIANRLNESMKDPSYWLTRTRVMAYRGLNLDDVATEVSFLDAVTPAMIKECFNAYYRADSTWTIITRPAGS